MCHVCQKHLESAIKIMSSGIVQDVSHLHSNSNSLVRLHSPSVCSVFVSGPAELRNSVMSTSCDAGPKSESMVWDRPAFMTPAARSYTIVVCKMMVQSGLGASTKLGMHHEHDIAYWPRYNEITKYMQPLKCLDETSDHTAWMSMYVKGRRMQKTWMQTYNQRLADTARHLFHSSQFSELLLRLPRLPSHVHVP